MCQTLFQRDTTSREVQSTVETAPNEAIHSCQKQGLISPVYLLSEPYKSVAPTRWGCFQVISGKSWCSGKRCCWLAHRLAVPRHDWVRCAICITPQHAAYQVWGYSPVKSFLQRFRVLSFKVFMAFRAFMIFWGFMVFRGFRAFKVFRVLGFMVSGVLPFLALGLLGFWGKIRKLLTILYLIFVPGPGTGSPHPRYPPPLGEEGFPSSFLPFSFPSFLSPSLSFSFLPSLLPSKLCQQHITTTRGRRCFATLLQSSKLHLFIEPFLLLILSLNPFCFQLHSSKLYLLKQPFIELWWFTTTIPPHHRVL